MPYSKEYITQSYYSIEDILHCCERAERAYHQFKGFRSGAPQFATFSHDSDLPGLDTVSGVQYGCITVYGYLPTNRNPFPSFREVLARGMPEIGKMGRHVGRIADTVRTEPAWITPEKRMERATGRH